MKYIITWTVYFTMTIPCSQVTKIQKCITHKNYSQEFRHRSKAFDFYRGKLQEHVMSLAQYKDSVMIFIPYDGAVNNVKIDSTIEITKK